MTNMHNIAAKKNANTSNANASGNPFRPANFADAYEKLVQQVDVLFNAVNLETGEDSVFVSCFDGHMVVGEKGVELYFSPREGGRPRDFKHKFKKPIKLKNVPRQVEAFCQWFAKKY